MTIERKITQYTIPAMFLLCPFLIMSLGYIWDGQQLFLMVAFMAILATMIKNAWLRYGLLYMALWQSFLFIRALFDPVALFPHAMAAFTQSLFMTAGFGVYLAISKSKIKLARIFDVICVAAIIQSIIGVLQVWVGFDFTNWLYGLILDANNGIGDKALVGSLGNPNYYAAFLAMSIPLFFRKHWLYFIPLVAIMVLESMSSSAAIPMIIGGTIAALHYSYEDWKDHKDWLIPMIGTSCCLTFLYLFALDKPVWTNPRIEMWVSVMGQIFHSLQGFFVGFGPAANWGQPFLIHSEWITLFHQYGLIGLIIAGGYLITVSRKNVYLLSALIIGVLNMLGNSTLHIAPTAFMVCIIAGLIERESGLGCGNIPSLKGSTGFSPTLLNGEAITHKRGQSK